MAAGAGSDKLRKMEDSKMPAKAERELVSIQRLVVAVQMGLAKRLIIQRRGIAQPREVNARQSPPRAAIGEHHHLLIPKGLHHSAQGCEARATLGERIEKTPQPCEGCINTAPNPFSPPCRNHWLRFSC